MSRRVIIYCVTCDASIIIAVDRLAADAGPLNTEDMMSLKATVTSHDDVTIIGLDGKITLGDGSGTLRETLKTVLAGGAKKVLLDLGGVSYIDSAGLGELVGCYTTAKNQGATLKLLHLQKRVEGLMQMTKLYLVFEAFEDEPEAVRSFGAASVALG